MGHPLFPVVAIGDVHGNLQVLTRCLQDLGFIDDAGRWSGGSRQLVQLGDTIDRGPDSLAALGLMARLRDEAAAAGGALHLLVGNHESMALMAGAGSHRLRMHWMYNGGDSVYSEWAGPDADRHHWPYPEGFYSPFSVDGVYGQFIGTWQGALQIGEFIFIHAGLPVDYQGNIEAFNSEMTRVLADPSELVARAERLTQDPLVGTGGPLWMREFDQGAVARQLQRWQGSTVVAGHSVGDGIRRSLGGTLLQIDVGMAFRGLWAAVGIDDAGRIWGLTEGIDALRLAGGDGMLVPIPAETAPPSDDETDASRRRRFGPGDLVVLYRSVDKTYTRLFRIEGVRELFSTPCYHGIFVDLIDGKDQATSGEWPVERVDRFGRIPQKTPPFPLHNNPNHSIIIPIVLPEVKVESH